MCQCSALFENCENNKCTEPGAYCRMADSTCVCNETTHYQTSGQNPTCSRTPEEEKSNIQPIVIVLVTVPLVVAVGMAIAIIAVVRRWTKNAYQDQTLQHADERGLPQQQRRHFSTFTEEEVMDWLKSVNVERCTTIFRGYNGNDISKLSKDDFVLLCGPTDGLRLYNRLHKRIDVNEDQTSRNREDGLYAELDETTREKSNYDDIQIEMGTITTLSKNKNCSDL